MSAAPVQGAEILSQLESDLVKIRQVVRETEGNAHAPDSALEYLAANHQLIDFLIEQVYTQKNLSERKELAHLHTELNANAIYEEFGRLASGVLQRASAFRERRQAGIPVHITEEDLDAILKVLQYLKYIKPNPPKLQLQRSPIENYGLKRPFGNFLDVTEEESKQVPWELSDILFAEKKRSIEQELNSSGLHLASRSVELIVWKYGESVERWTKILIELLDFRVQCDWAVVTSVHSSQRDKWVNAVDTCLFR